MRIAIAGTNGLAYWIARYLSTETSHQFILLSRAVSLADIFKDSADLIQPKPHLSAEGWQVITVDYGNDFDLQFKLAGVDLVISMVSGQAQIALIDAAAHVGVQRFAPAEFAGSSLDRPAMDALDRGQSAALARLRQYEAQGMRYTVLSCGILYERFAPGGTGSANIGYFSGASGEGDYLMDIRAMRAQIPHNSYGQPATICMTSAQDVGRFVVSALVLQNWPRELRMYGERIDVSEVVRVAEEMRSISTVHRNNNTF